MPFTKGLVTPRCPSLTGGRGQVRKCWSRSHRQFPDLGDRARFSCFTHLDAAQPVPHVWEGILRRDIVHQHDSVCLPEELLGDAVVPAYIFKWSLIRSKEVSPRSDLKPQWESWKCMSTKKAKPRFCSYRDHRGCTNSPSAYFYLNYFLYCSLSAHTAYRVPS